MGSMKKIVLSLGLLLIVCSLSAQEKGQFVLQAEANAGILFCYPYQGTFNSIDLEGAIGPVLRYQVGDRLGIGIGVNYCAHQALQYLPIFADAKYSFGIGKSRPYAELRAGYAFRLKYVKHENGDPNWYSVEGFYSQLILGYSIGHSDIGIGGQLVNMEVDSTEWPDILPGGCLTFTNNHLKPAVFLHYAYRFYFGKQTPKIQ